MLFDRLILRNWNKLKSQKFSPFDCDFIIGSMKFLRMAIFFTFQWLTVSEVVASNKALKGYDLPVLPANLPLVEQAASYGKLIPRNIWVAVRDKNDELPGHLKIFFSRNPLWEKHICDNECKDKFMNEVLFFPKKLLLSC